MAYISKFKSDTAYSNLDINEVLSAITGAGVAPSSPNDILANVAESGVTLSDKRCEVSWADEDRTSVKIGSGTVIMPDGSYIIISDEVLPVTGEELHYVYIYSDLIHQNIPLCEKTLPQDGRDYVLLATVENGQINDKRPLAFSKIANYGSRPIIEVSPSLGIPQKTIPAGTPLFTLDIGEGYSKAIILSQDKGLFAIYNFEKGLFDISFPLGGSRLYQNQESFSLPSVGSVKLAYVNGTLSLTSKKDLYTRSESGYTVYLTVF